MLEQMIQQYEIKNDEDRFNALREIFQEVALAGLYRGDFFKHAAFYGGTALRIFYGLDRYSEDLDFSLLASRNDFKLETYFQAIKDEFKALGITIDIDKKTKKVESNIESAFLKNSTTMHTLELEAPMVIDKPIKIKFEVDTNPPLGFDTQEKLLLRPFSFYVKCFHIKDLYAGKMHALLYRNWKQRVKGRDWYDFEWYVKNNFSINLAHLSMRAKQSGNLKEGQDMTKSMLFELLDKKIDTLDIEMAKIDIKRFIKDDKVLDIWSKEYFKELKEKISF